VGLRGAERAGGLVGSRRRQAVELFEVLIRSCGRDGVSIRLGFSRRVHSHTVVVYGSGSCGVRDHAWIR
jgi:hypothetical protein